MMNTTIYPWAAMFYNELRSLHDRFIAPQIESMVQQFGDEYLGFLEKVLGQASASASFDVVEKKVFSVKQFQSDSNDMTETFCAVCTA